MGPPPSWPAFAGDLDAIEGAPTVADLQAALAPLLLRLEASLLVTAVRVGPDASAPSLETELQRDDARLPGRVRTELARAILHASAGRAAPVKLAEVGGEGAALRRLLEAADAGDALLFPRFDGRGRRVSLLAGARLRLEERSTFIFTRILVEAAVTKRESLKRRTLGRAELLTQRQRDCLDAALRGANSIQIGAALNLAPKTVDAYIAAAAQRLGAGNRVAAVGLAVQLGLIGDV